MSPRLGDGVVVVERPKLVQEVEHCLEIFGLTSGTQLLERGRTLFYSGVESVLEFSLLNMNVAPLPLLVIVVSACGPPFTNNQKPYFYHLRIL